MSGSLLNEYISKRMGALDLETELIRLVQLYNDRKGSYLLIYAVGMDKGNITDISLNMEDYHIIHEIRKH